VSFGVGESRRTAEIMTVLNSKNFQIRGWKFTLEVILKCSKNPRLFGKDLVALAF
jgi:hypothetical protein